MQYPDSNILLFAKAPEPGKVKTRLAPIIGKTAAAHLYQQLLITTVETVTRASVAPITCYCAPDVRHPLFERLAARHNVELKQQQGIDLGERMAHAAAATLESSHSVILIGADCPLLNKKHLQLTLHWLHVGVNAVIGPAEDGGYFLLGLRRFNCKLFEKINWGSNEVLKLTRQRLRELSWSWQELEPLWDLDRPEDLLRYQQVGLPSTS